MLATLPGSPLVPYLHGTSQTLTPLIVAFAAVAATAMTASALQAPRPPAQASAGYGGSTQLGGSSVPIDGGPPKAGTPAAPLSAESSE